MLLDRAHQGRGRDSAERSDHVRVRRVGAARVAVRVGGDERDGGVEEWVSSVVSSSVTVDS